MKNFGFFFILKFIWEVFYLIIVLGIFLLLIREILNILIINCLIIFVSLF